MPHPLGGVSAHPDIRGRLFFVCSSFLGQRGFYGSALLQQPREILGAIPDPRIVFPSVQCWLLLFRSCFWVEALFCRSRGVMCSQGLRYFVPRVGVLTHLYILQLLFGHYNCSLASPSSACPTPVFLIPKHIWLLTGAFELMPQLQHIAAIGGIAQAYPLMTEYVFRQRVFLHATLMPFRREKLYFLNICSLCVCVCFFSI